MNVSPANLFLFLLCALVSGGILPRAAHAQEIPPLILEEKTQIQVKKSQKKEPKKDQDTQTPAVPTPRPEDVFVAMVNSRVLTRAELEFRVSREFERVKKDVQQRFGGVISTSDDGNVSLSDIAAKQNEVLQEQTEQIEVALNQEEGASVQTWIEHSLLAEEARRQGIFVTEDQFRSRLADAERESRLDADEVNQGLKNLRISRADYERGVYDALLIEGLLNRFMDLNYTEDTYRQAYAKNPQLYREPAKYLLAHFSIALDGSESKAQLSKFRSLAQEVRAKLRTESDPEQLFRDDRYDRIQEGIFGSVPGWFALTDNSLPKAVQAEMRKLKVGETSDVITVYQRGDNGQPQPISFHVIRVLDGEQETGQTFETALPAVRRVMLDVARQQVLESIRAAKTHRVLTNLGGIPPDKIPSREELIKSEAAATPVNLVMNRPARRPGEIMSNRPR